MSASILVAYATRYGSTQEVAETVASELRQRGLDVAVRPMREVQSLEEYDAVVLGAAVYIGKWHKDAQNFLTKHTKAQMQRPVALFALGPISTDPNEMKGSREQFEKELATYAWLKPVAMDMFIGKFDPDKLRFPDKLLTVLPASPLHNLPAADHRNWDAIRAWAGSLVAQFSLPEPQ